MGGFAICLAVVGLFAVVGWVFRQSGRPSDGVPTPALDEPPDEDIHHAAHLRAVRARTVRSSASEAQAARLARGSDPPPIAEVASGEFMIRLMPDAPRPDAKRATTHRPRVTEQGASSRSIQIRRSKRPSGAGSS
ncbi:MAG: hypothetical protein H6Q90_1446 [Deltaproteobacteria bacterium]|nr:hypothetical protein [Deltaproteobacteria bacterium]